MLHWFDEAQFTESGEFIYTYLGLGDYVATMFMLLFTMLVVFRSGLCFKTYIYTGKFGDPERSVLIGSIERGKLYFKYILTGFHPAGIVADSMVFLLFAMFNVFLWGIFLVGGLTILLAYIMRKRIAHKQEFIANLKGEQFHE